MSLPYFKMYPRDFLDGTIGLSLEEKGAYLLVLNMIYMRDGHLEDNAAYIAGQLGCSVRKWSSLREALIIRGKIICNSGFISNSRADKIIDELRTYQDKQTENGKKPKKDNRIKKPPLKPDAKPEDNQSQSQSEESSLDKSKLTLSGEREVTFDAFRKAYPNPDGLSSSQREFDAAVEAGAAEKQILTGLNGWLAKWRRDGTLTRDGGRWLPKARNWLADRCWLDPIDGGTVTALATRKWPATDECAAIREAVVAEKSKSFAVSYLDFAEWDPPGRIIAATSYAKDELRKLDCLTGLTITAKEAKAA